MMQTSAILSSILLASSVLISEVKATEDSSFGSIGVDSSGPLEQPQRCVLRQLGSHPACSASGNGFYLQYTPYQDGSDADSSDTGSPDDDSRVPPSANGG